MNKLWILGLGPGHKDYILPIVKKKLREADIVVGGKRHLESVETSAIKRKLDIPLYKTIDYLKDNYKNNQIAVIVSGDTGFFSMLDLLKTHFKNEELETYPGISSLQYMFSKLNKSYKNAYIGSVHGREIDFKSIVNYKIIGLLTDKIMTPEKIRGKLNELNLKGKIFVGENLSYENEKIGEYNINSIINVKYSSLSVVVIEIE